MLDPARAPRGEASRELQRGASTRPRGAAERRRGHGAPTRACRAAAAAACAALIPCLAGCFEPAVKETLEITFDPGDKVRIAIEVEIRDPDDGSDRARSSAAASKLLRDRIATLRMNLLDGTDAWSRRFAAAAPVREHLSFDKEEGSLVRVVRSAELRGPGELRAFFADTLADLTYRSGEGWAEVTLTPLSGSRANEAQRRRWQAEIEQWSPKVSAYLGAAVKLYAYLNRHPDRARSCLGELFEEVLDTPYEDQDLEGEELRLVDTLEERIGDLLEAFVRRDDAELSLNELAQIVLDPLPAAPVTIRVAGRILEVEGARRAEDPNAVSIPSLNLLEAIGALEGQWISPDPVRVLLDAGFLGGGGPIDLDRLVERPRSYGTAPRSEELVRSLEARLSRPPFYRVRWSTAGTFPRPPHPASSAAAD